MRATFVLDCDGTIDTGVKGQVHPAVPQELAGWIAEDANIVFSTNRSTKWVCDHVLVPIGAKLERVGSGLVFAICEQGAVTSMVNYVSDGTPIFGRRFTCPLRHKDQISRALESCIDGRQIRGRLRRGLEQQVCVELSEPCSVDPMLLIPKYTRATTRMIRTRSTLTYVDHGAGKCHSLGDMLRRFPELRDGYLLAFGDDGDDFAQICPTIDVDALRRKTFDGKGLSVACAYEQKPFERLGLPALPASPELDNGLAKGTGYATAAILSAAHAVLT